MFFFWNCGRVDFEIGETPVRQQFPVPTELARTSPHDVLLERFRESSRKNIVLEVFFFVSSSLCVI